MKIFELFPAVVATEYYRRPESFKKKFFENAEQYTREDGITGEESGHIDLHWNPDFEALFSFITVAANDYIEKLVGSRDIWQPWLVKTWFSDFTVPSHDHSDAHLSFVYYVNIPEGKDYPLHFIPPANRYTDLVKGMFLANKNIESVKEFNQYNCETVMFKPEEGMLLIFPAHMEHMVEPHRPEYGIPLEEKRISIAGDFILTFREKTARSMGLQPVSNWRAFG